MRLWKRRYMISAWLALSLAGCGKHEKATSGQAGPAQTEPTHPSAPSKTVPAESVRKGMPRDYAVNGQVDLEALNKTLRDYVKLRKVIPKDLNELVTSGYLSSLPMPPPGKRFVIALHPMGYAVVLADQ